MTDATGPPLRFGVLGPLRVWQGENAVDLGPVQQRVVLAVLLLQGGHPIARQQLIKAVWGEAPPTHAVNLVQRHVSGLRRVLGLGRPGRDASCRLVWTEAGYLLALPAGVLDLEVFHGKLEQARAARAAGDLQEAAAALHSALGLWRGPLCDGLCSPFLDAQRDRLAESCVNVIEDRAELDLALGKHVDLIAELRELVADHPLRERLHGLLMLALYRAGRQADALATYRAARRYLQEELGVEPAAPLQRLHQQILSADQQLAPPAQWGTPVLQSRAFNEHLPVLAPGSRKPQAERQPRGDAERTHPSGEPGSLVASDQYAGQMPVGSAPVSAPRHIREQILAVRDAVEGERKQVTVLLCDMVPSSELVAELGPEERRVAADRFFRMALAEVYRYEGTINQVRDDGFVALFGAPIGHEDHARRAVLAALTVVARSQLRVVIGINSGQVVMGTISDDLRADYTPVGDTTVLAARLQAAAPPGAVLVSQRTAGLVRGYFQVEEVFPVKVEERTVYPVLVTGLGTRTAPVSSGDELSPFTGRGRELAELRRALEVAVGGEGQVIGLVGDPGLGKSRLAFELRRLAEPDVAVIEGRCLSYGASIPYLPLFELVRNACGVTVDDSPDRAASKMDQRARALGLDVLLAHHLRHAFGVAADDAGPAALDPQAMRDRAFEALRRLLVAQAGHRPLVVVVEDLHWIDQTSEDFLAEFVDELPSVPILLLVTYRPGYLPPWMGKSFTSQLALHPLSLTSSQKIVTWMLAGRDLGAGAAIAARGEGNPFFLEELARAVRGHAVDAASVTVPETIQQVLAARIDQLNADQKAALQLAAILGRDFSLELAGHVWGGNVPLEGMLQELKRLEFLRERHGVAERTFVFKHALTREVAYDGISQARRRYLHGRAGAALEQSRASQLFECCEQLAYHYSHSADSARAVPYLTIAGDRARDRYANEEAIAVYSQAISLMEEMGGEQWPDTYGTVCESVASVLQRQSRYDEAIEAYRKGLRVARGAFQQAHLHVLCAGAETSAHRYREALTQCDLAEQALGPASDRPDAEWLSPWFDIQNVRMSVLYWLNDTKTYARLIQQVRPFAQAHGSTEQRASFFYNILSLSLLRDRFLVTDQTLQFAQDAYKAAQEAGPEVLWGAEFTVGFTLLWHGDLDEATAMLQNSLREAERRGEATMKSRATTYLMVAMRKRGDVEGVRKAIPSAIEQAREAGLPEYEAMATANRAWVAWRSGEEQTAATDAQAALDTWEKLSPRYFVDWMALWPLVAMSLASQRIAQAAEYARRMLPPPQQLLQEPTRALVDSAVQAWDDGEPAETEELLRRAVRAAGDLGYL